MVGEKLRTQGLAWANYTRNIHGEAGGLQQSITRCVQVRLAQSFPHIYCLMGKSRRQNGFPCPEGQKEKALY